MRQRYKKIYEDYRPQFMAWRLVLLSRKLLFAAIVVLVNKNIELQYVANYVLSRACWGQGPHDQAP